MKNTTINISIPKQMYEDAKVFAKNSGYSSVSELIRDALRRILYGQENKNRISTKNK